SKLCLRLSNLPSRRTHRPFTPSHREWSMRCQLGQNLPGNHKDPTHLRHRWKHRTPNNDIQRKPTTTTTLLQPLSSDSRSTMVSRRRSHSLDRQQELSPDKKRAKKPYTFRRLWNAKGQKLLFRPATSSTIRANPFPRMRPTSQEKHSRYKNDPEQSSNSG